MDIKKDILQRNIKIKNTCWEWQGFLMPNGYGRIYYDKKTYYVHRLSFECFKTEIPKGLLVCHTCDNRKCINPEHLWLGTAKQNTQDALDKGKMKTWLGKKHSLESILKMRKPKKCDRKGEKHPNSKLNNTSVKEIRELLKSGLTHSLISKKYGISKCTVTDINTGKSWSHI